jgi:transcriptional regulator with XRE-family HTH domain
MYPYRIFTFLIFAKSLLFYDIASFVKIRSKEQNFLKGCLHGWFLFAILKGMGKKAVPETINRRIKQVREALNMTQAAFSRVISLSSGYLAGVEVEKRKVNDRLVKLICSSFTVNEQWLRTGTGDMFASAGNEMFIKLAGLFKELGPKYRRYILKEIELLLEMQDTDETV